MTARNERLQQCLTLVASRSRQKQEYRIRNTIQYGIIGCHNKVHYILDLYLSVWDIRAIERRQVNYKFIAASFSFMAWVKFQISVCLFRISNCLALNEGPGSIMMAAFLRAFTSFVNVLC
jgi:hypothetical protein